MVLAHRIRVMSVAAATQFHQLAISSLLDRNQSTAPSAITKKQPPMKKLVVPEIRTLSRFFATAAVTLTFVSAPISIDIAKAQQSVTEQEAHAIGVNAYLYFYPLLSVDITRRQSINVEPGKEI